ncbi:MAG: hypothetical protein R2857_01935 [Vampirovibrionales bacterium]
MPSPLKPLLLPKWVHWTKAFQETALINRGTLDALGYATAHGYFYPQYLERKEKMVEPYHHHPVCIPAGPCMPYLLF